MRARWWGLTAGTLAIGGAVALGPAPRCGAAAAEDFVQAVKCRDCHPDIFAEWKESQHAKAWSDPRFQAALKAAPAPETCTPCHAPNAILDAGIGVMPTVRGRYKSEGVSCVTCHQKGEAYAGPFGAKAMDPVGHYSAEVKEFRTHALCATCHGQEKELVHNQVREYLKGQFAADGTTCQECHMPKVSRPIAVDALGKKTFPKREGRKHTFAGSHDAAMLRKAARVEVAVKGRTADVTVANHDCGHSIPAAADRVLRLVVEITPAGGAATRKVEVLDWEKRLAVKATRVLPVALPEGKGTLRATLYHCFALDDEEAEWQKMTSRDAAY